MAISMDVMALSIDMDGGQRSQNVIKFYVISFNKLLSNIITRSHILGPLRLYNSEWRRERDWAGKGGRF